MNLWQRLFGGRQSSQWAGGGATRSKIYVTEAVALQSTAFLRAARVIAQGVAMMPLKLYIEENTDERRVRKVARDHKSYRAICYQPCWLTKFEFVETLTLHAVVGGDGFAFINRGGEKSGPIRELIPLSPRDVTFSVNEDWEPVYKLAWTGFNETFGAGQILHIRGPSWDGRIGMNVIEKAREALGLARSLENAQSSLMGQDARPAGVLSTEQPVTVEAAAKIRDRWRENYGPGGKNGVAVLDNGYKFSSIQMTAVDAQHIESRKFQIEEIARATDVFPLMLMHSDKNPTFASASEFFRAHVTWTLQPWVQRWEEALKRDAIGWDGKEADVWARMTMESLMRGAPKETAEYMEKLIDRGVISPNDAREILNLNPREGGDEYLTPLNMRVGDAEPVDEGKPSAKPPAEDDDAET